MTKTLEKEIEQIMKSQSLTCPVDKFVKNANWYSLSMCQSLSVEFLEHFIDNINWVSFSSNKQIPEDIKQQFSYNY